MRTRRIAFRAAAAAMLAAVLLMLAAPHPWPSAITRVAFSPVYTLSITSMTPQFARSGSTITVSGTVTNHSEHAVTGLAIQLVTTTSEFGNPSEMQAYRDSSAYSGNQAGNGYNFPGSIPDGATVRWSASFTAAAVGFSGFGVYGLAAEALFPSNQQIVASEGTYLPYWPSSGQPSRMNIAWIWPLMDTPRETSCEATLTDPSLKSALSPSGRLGVLLATGLSFESTARLTWAVDPALLSEASTMSRPYWTGGQADCTQTIPHPASAAAGRWLSELSTSTAGAPMFTTPYADVDVSALSHAGLGSGQSSDLANAYSLGNSVTMATIHRTSGDVAWPADGVADASVLQTIAETGHVSTVVLNSSQMPLTGSSFEDDAVASFTTGVGTRLRVLLANDTITSELGAASNSSAGSQFGVAQDVLAQTAMIASEAPNTARSIVVAPPRRWNPSAALASALLSETSTAPWLRSVTLATVAASSAPPGQTRAQPADRVVPRGELSTGYMNAVKRTDASLGVLNSLVPDASSQFTNRIRAAQAATQSSAWRGNESAGRVALSRLSAYVSDSMEKVRLIGVRKATLAGNSGVLPVSVRNDMSETIVVRVEATAAPSRLSVGGSRLVTVPPGQTRTLTLPLQSHRVGSTQVKLQLVTRDGMPLPGPAEAVSVVSTLYGRAVLVLIIVALAIVVLTSTTRWFRQWIADGRSGAHAARPPAGGARGEDDGDGGGR